ncbi:MAG TPA: hypothetical protein VHX65_15010 [Pirellulales bacterium]|nr:hypothetical protein [Pirellulales bacterium]
MTDAGGSFLASFGMSGLPRLAIGSVSPETDYRPAVWAVFDSLDRQGVRIQSFLPRACLAEIDAASVVTGIAPRHLDSWLMTRDFCRHTFLRVARQSDLAIVEGDLSVASADPPGGTLGTLCDWLALPRLGVWNVRGLADHHLSTRRPLADALLIDGVASKGEFYRLQTMIESLWRLPVIGALPAAPELRQAIRQISPGERPSRELCESLGDALLEYTRPSALLDLAQQRNFLSIDHGDGFIPLPGPLPAGERVEASERLRKLVRRGPAAAGEPRLTVAVAYDEVFRGYFPDTLDALEQLGATVRDFSPLHDEALPSDCDIVYIGCGKPQLRIDELAENHCLHAALRDHVCSGRRIYAEGGGMAFLCQHLVLPDGRRAAMAGVLPAAAHLSAERRPPRPIELSLSGSRWLGQKGQRLRGYLNENWRIEPTGSLTSCAVEPEHQCDLVERHQAIGSRVHFDLAAQPALLESFLQPCPAALVWAAAR